MKLIIFILSLSIFLSCKSSAEKENKPSDLKIISKLDTAGKYKIKKTKDSSDFINITDTNIINLIYSLQLEVHKKLIYGGDNPLLEFEINNNLTQNKVSKYAIFESLINGNTKYYFYHNHYTIEIDEKELNLFLAVFK
jgi:hypothetical protein